MKKLKLLAAFLLVGLTSLYAQDKNLISGNFVESTFDDFAEKIESQTEYTFYYDRKLFDSFRITIQVKDVFLPSLLNKVFEKTQFEFSIDKKNNVFITQGKPLALNLPSGFFEGQALVIAESRNQENREENKVKKVNVQSGLENKLFSIGTPGGRKTGGKVNVSGYVRSVDNGEELSGVNISVEGTKIQVMTDQFGYYSLLLPTGKHVINYSFMGAFDTRRQTMLYSDGRLNVDMLQKIIQLKEVIIEPEKERNIRSTVMGMEQLKMAAIRQIPTVMGEIDVLRVIQNLPGVKTVGEASTGMNVRGGATDQNLILFNDLNIYNPTHLFGFFSAINPDVIKDVNLYKSSIPAKYGGRISSVLDIISLDGNSKKITGSAGIGLLTSKLSVNGPIVKDKTTFVIGLRSTYSDWLFKLLPKDYEKSSGSFYDGTIHISHKINKKNQLYLNGYVSNDKFSLDAPSRYQYQNMNGNIKWKHNFNSRFYSVFLAGVDSYTYTSKDSVFPSQAYQLKYKIDQYKTKVDFSYFLSNRHTFTFGASSQLYKVMPGEVTPWNHSLRNSDALQIEQALESALYFSDQFNISEKLSIEAGARVNMYNYLGPQTMYEYAPGFPLNSDNIINTKTYAKGKIIYTSILPDYRVGMRYMLSGKMSMKASVNTLSQFIHQISNTTAVTPTDIWKLSNQYIAPQQGTQASLGLYRNFKNNTIETSIEVYYKWIKNYLDYKSGANLLMNHHLETDVFKTKGKAYGAEFFVKKTTGKLNGWISYTYSRSFIKQNDPLADETINHGNYYPSNFDQPHSVAVIGNYKLSHRFSVSMNMNYNTGRPITLPIGIFDYEGAPRMLYSDRNEYRIPDYFRTDFSINIEGNHKIHQLTHNFWTLGVYNLTARRNAYSVYFVTEEGKVKGYKLSIFGTAIPYLTFNIRF
ncbi:MAG: carboxypeptidase-like regulatory domain-containing protein [Ginsengibacter sp.]